jgi:hypothetical protein
MGFLFGKTAQGTYVVVAFWIACYYFFRDEALCPLGVVTYLRPNLKRGQGVKNPNRNSSCANMDEKVQEAQEGRLDLRKYNTTLYS